MPQFFVAVQHPQDFVPSFGDEAMMNDISALNREMIAAGVRNFACGLGTSKETKSLRAQADGSILITDGPYIEAKEYAGGFWILECADMDEALAWGRKAVVACRTPVEVRGIFFKPGTEHLNKLSAN